MQVNQVYLWLWKGTWSIKLNHKVENFCDNMTSIGPVHPSSGFQETSTSGAIDRLPDEMNEMSIRDDKVTLC